MSESPSLYIQRLEALRTQKSSLIEKMSSLAMELIDDRGSPQEIAQVISEIWDDEILTQLVKQWVRKRGAQFGLQTLVPRITQPEVLLEILELEFEGNSHMPALVLQCLVMLDAEEDLIQAIELARDVGYKWIAIRKLKTQEAIARIVIGETLGFHCERMKALELLSDDECLAKVAIEAIDIYPTAHYPIHAESDKRESEELRQAAVRKIESQAILNQVVEKSCRLATQQYAKSLLTS